MKHASLFLCHPILPRAQSTSLCWHRRRRLFCCCCCRLRNFMFLCHCVEWSLITCSAKCIELSTSIPIWNLSILLHICFSLSLSFCSFCCWCFTALPLPFSLNVYKYLYESVLPPPSLILDEAAYLMTAKCCDTKSLSLCYRWLKWLLLHTQTFSHRLTLTHTDIYRNAHFHKYRVVLNRFGSIWQLPIEFDANINSQLMLSACRKL